MSAVPSDRTKIALLCLVLFCCALFLSALSAKKPAISRAGLTLVAEILRPFQVILKGTSASVSGLWERYLALYNLRQEYEALQHKVQALEVNNSALREWEGEIKRLHQLLSLAEEKQLKGVAADVIGYDPSNWAQVITVDRGSSDGIRQGMPAIQGDAVVGQVVAVAPRSSRILLITDHTSGIDCIVQSSRARGLIEGDGSTVCHLRYLPQDEEVAVGDRIITSGIDGIFPKGLLVGVVTALDKRSSGMFQSVRVKPAVNFAKLETVLILTAPPKIDPELFESPDNVKRPATRTAGE